MEVRTADLESPGRFVGGWIPFFNRSGYFMRDENMMGGISAGSGSIHEKGLAELVPLSVEDFV